MNLAEHLPDANVLISLEPEELGLYILRALSEGRQSDISLDGFTRTALQAYAGNANRDEVIEALREAWAWLEGQALLLSDPRFRGAHEYRVLSRRAFKIATDPSARRASRGYILPKDMLNASVREEVWGLYHRGKYDTAVFEAMKAVEVAVRNAANLNANDIGVPLMRKAFDVSNGVLTDASAERGERQALSDLFSGAIGAYKNPHSHRDVALTNPDEAAEIILLANHLLRIVDGRRE
ncbi:TIGR02391 family protein [Rhodoplanes roseus]|uniref:TIGR02391 family protein n=1 Tax=Rhodoplanes roseus TaxID=29409 RepID=A0A327L870_9BRAD|nr:TIGR02391 family protein [Rhodoplanes roseus]RAI43878.1 TIGR02391 family protein [Rhodoplanes roseus]